MSDTLITKKGRNQKHDIIEELHSYSLLLDTREIFLHGELGDNNDDCGVDFKMSNKFLKNIRFLESAGDDPIIIHQHSIGGSWCDGMLIYDMVANCSCHVIFIMHGIAASMGSIVPQAADTRVVMPNCSFMIHDGYTGIDVDMTHKQAQTNAEYEQRILDQMLDIYCSVCINSKWFRQEQADEKRVKQFLREKIDQKQDWWLFARDTVLYGFADAVLGDEGYENIENIKDLINDN